MASEDKKVDAPVGLPVAPPWRVKEVIESLLDALPEKRGYHSWAADEDKVKEARAKAQDFLQEVYGVDDQEG